MSVDLSHIGQRLRAARITAGLSQLELAQKLGVTQGTVSRAEIGRDIRASTLVELARALDLDLMMIPRRLRSTIDHLVEGGPSDHAAVYTGAGDEPYYEGEPDEAAGASPAGISPYNLARYSLRARRRARNEGRGST